MRPSLRPWRRRVVAVAREMASLGLVKGSAGNVSCRVRDVILITPSGIPYELLRPQQIVSLPLDGDNERDMPVPPSSEWRMHVAIYRARDDVRAIVHTHPPYAIVASLSGPLPVVSDEGRVLFGESVPVSRHAKPGTWELAEAVAEALGVGKAALIARHGAVTVGRTLSEALRLAVKLEEMASLWALSRYRG